MRKLRTCPKCKERYEHHEQHKCVPTPEQIRASNNAWVASQPVFAPFCHD